MSQTLILDNVIKFLDLTSKKYLIELKTDKENELKKNPKNTKLILKKYNKIEQDHQQYIERLKQELKDQGYCVGFSICHAAMDISGKLDWWEHILADLANWDGNADDLNKEIVLPKYEEENKITYEMSEHTDLHLIENKVVEQDEINISIRENIYVRVLNYVLYNFGSMDEAYHDFMPSGINQSNILQSDAFVSQKYKHYPEKKQSYFELLDGNDKIKTIKQRKKVAGFFSEDELHTLLNKHMIEGTICLIHSLDHVIRIGYKNSKWILYDPNDNHKKIPIKQTYEYHDKSKMIKEIFNSLHNQSVCIEIATIDEKKEIAFPHYGQLSKNSAENLLKDCGLHIIARNTPETLLDIINNTNLSMNKAKIYSALSDALIKKDVNGVPGLHAIIHYAPQCLPELFKLANQSSKEGLRLRSAITDGMDLKDSTKWTGLHMMTQFAPQYISTLFEMADDSKLGLELRDVIADSLVEKEDLNNCTALAEIARTAPETLTKAIELALSTKNNEINWHEYIVAAFAAEDKQRITGWEAIESHASKYKKNILDIVFKHLLTLDTKTLTNFKTDLEDALTNPTSDYRGLCKKQPFMSFAGMEYGKTSIWKNLHEKTTSILRNREKKDKGIKLSLI